MKLKSFLLRYYPPGIMLEYEKHGELKTKSIDLLDLGPSTDVSALVEEIQKAEPLITAAQTEQVKLLIHRLQEKLGQHSNHTFYLFKVLKAHILPLTNVALNKSGSCDKIATGSFDKTCKLWSVETGKCYHTFRGHTAEIVCLSFNPQSTLVATGSMDTTAKLWNIQNGEEVCTLRESRWRLALLEEAELENHAKRIFKAMTGHSGEVISLSFNTSGDRIITGSFDHTVVVWDADTGRKVHILIGHCAEISSALFNWDCSLILTGSMDKTCMLWNATNGKCVATLTGHDDEILDSCFDYTGKLIATASADGTARIFSAATRKCIAKLEGHEGEISKISFNPQGNRLLTGSSDKTARIWDAQTGQCLQVLEGHTDEIFSCTFNYKGNIVITGSKDNTCRIWR
ncbi:dynein assembly factor with WDR repeat domains 1 isoform X4 [Trachypithecus francoisi]|uniref:dynein assembly factor with WDR repeat domains 1 isoform X4 n=1 Tax=Trachypithecus francoisi TaxID=54180 RepID=UPI00141B7564|nr:dynein assembly factor with WDR repeat domains 1 isoform X4 [Trachypithecus francoisi]